MGEGQGDYQTIIETGNIFTIPATVKSYVLLTANMLSTTLT